ncbi:uridine phosphorylase [Neobacillus notoginsengisoli]|uniref:Uridine phosphorylase n=1 Tax=Neobacillus notoginsengisoli TaxID=1578198 RepID=A0A417YIT9_9BACI|nr:uridine phosphorylase [Neobacillus notoginsengisoli]RHW32857.1 uridine phosphorylase [Neobacillus notoginsengisoli]
MIEVFLNAKNNQYHVDLKEGDVGKYVFLPGDPGRVELIASLFDESWAVAENREYKTYTGTIDGIKVSVCSTGIGSPSAAIAVEELSRVGADTFIRIGTAGPMQDYIKKGDVVIGTSAIRDEGTTRQYMPLEFPAVADISVTNALCEAAKKLNKTYHAGIIQSKDSFYGEVEPETMPLAATLKERWQCWVAGGALASEMEAAAIYVISSIRKLKAGCILNMKGSMEETIKVGLEAIRILEKQSKES